MKFYLNFDITLSHIPSINHDCKVTLKLVIIYFFSNRKRGCRSVKDDKEKEKENNWGFTNSITTSI
jgi:hypothetical protein